MPVGDDVSVDSLVVDTEGYSGAEVSNHGTTHTACIVHLLSQEIYVPIVPLGIL